MRGTKDNEIHQGIDQRRTSRSAFRFGGNRVAYAQEDTIKVGVLHSLSGTMAISETTLKDAMLMLIEEQNEKGGLLGKQLEAVVVDPASDWPMFAEKARELIEQDKVDVVFGGWTSASRKAVLPVFEELNSLMFYRFSMRVRRASATCSTPVLLRTSRPFPPSIT